MRSGSEEQGASKQTWINTAHRSSRLQAASHTHTHARLFDACAALFGACVALFDACVALFDACVALFGANPGRGKESWLCQKHAAIRSEQAQLQAR